SICLAALPTEVTAMVRVPSADPATVTRLLDSGAMGIIFSDVRSAEGARSAVRMCRYPPSGTRSINWTIPQTGYRKSEGGQALAAVDQMTTIIVMVESREALAAVEEIASVEGI